MSAKTLSAVQIFSAAAPTSRRMTYSIEPVATTIPSTELPARPAELEEFLENENPLGCIRGVFWVTVFNAIVLLTAFCAWAMVKIFS